MSQTLNVELQQSQASKTHYDVVIVGAGPYGLSIAAHALARGLQVGIFGKPLHLWKEYMPKGMLLRSYWWATNFSDPQKRYGLATYFKEKGIEPFDPLPAEIIVDYGLWFQQHVVPNVDETYVRTIERKDGQFEVTLADGRIVESPLVVMAPGLQYFVYRPPEYDALPAELVSHTSQHRTFERLAGQSLVIVGAGQSALETAALAYESGVNVQVISRKRIAWIKDLPEHIDQRPLIEKILAPKAGTAPGWFHLSLEVFPYMFQRLPRRTKDQLLRGPGAHGPMGAAWLKPRLFGKVALHEGVRIEQVREGDGGIVLTLSDGTTMKADHLMLGTGYRMEVSKLPMLAPSLVADIKTYNGSPVLNNSFESTVPGLYFVGYSSTSSCGPVYRFVVGTEAAARKVSNTLVRQVQSGKVK